jgi:predicted DNA-binding transcriptional regulator YafY
VITTALTGWGGHAVPKPTTKKACRMADMVWLLREARMTVEQLAYLYGVSVWTIRRDLLDMQDEPMRVPLSQDDRGRWYVM